MKLSNDNKIHQVILKLDKDIPRERALRAFLDNASNNGINRKEAILRIFEEYSNSNPFKTKKEDNREMITLSKEEFEKMLSKNKENEELEMIKANKEVKDISDFDE